MSNPIIPRGRTLAIATACLAVAACSAGTSSPTGPGGGAAAPVVAEGSDVAVSAAAQTGPPWGPETPNFNLEVVLRGDGFGLVKFRQPNDGATIVYLDVWVRDLVPATEYLLQRAVDTQVDGTCTSDAWLTLGKGGVPQSITTDARGTGREELWRNIPAPPGAAFDIHFRVIDKATTAVVLQSDCYQFRVSL